MSNPVEAILGRAAIEALRRPIGEAVGLPGAAFAGEAFHALENERLFPRTWTVAGVASDIPNPGDAMPTTVAGLPILLLRDREGEVRAFHNVCRHRGMRLLPAPCKGQALLRCPWHSWAYALDGRLMATPNIGGVGVNESPDFDKAALGLKPVRVGVWLNTVFVNLDGKAPSLERHVAPYLEYYAAFDLSLLRHSGHTDREFRANWKLCIEGGIEEYHLPWVHPQFFTDVPNWTGRSVVDRTMIGSESWFDKNDVELYGSKRELPGFPGLNDTQRQTGNFMLLFPNAGLAIGPDHMAITHYVPKGVDRTYYRKDYYFIGEAATAPGYAAARDAVTEGWLEINDQDQGIVETLHENHRTRDRIGVANRFAPEWEGAIHAFQTRVLETVLA
jgi:phenylpropionate dioxygenase-like ring-hydroxylating dioxygenase large terminal subunit